MIFHKKLATSKNFPTSYFGDRKPTTVGNNRSAGKLSSPKVCLLTQYYNTIHNGWISPV